MPENDEGLFSSGQGSQGDPVDDEALLRLSTNPDFLAFIEVMKEKLRSARRHLDMRETDDMQAIGFYRGHIWLSRLLWRRVMVEAKQNVEAKMKKLNQGV